MALKDKLMTLEDFKAVRDVDVASNQTQFTAIKADLEDLEDAVDGLTGALTPEIKEAILNCFAHVAWADNQGQTYYDALEEALYADNVESISAVFVPGTHEIYTTDALDSLKNFLTVTATYTDSTQAVVTDYTLSGSISTAGTQTITVTYGRNNTTTFNVTVVSNPNGLLYEWDFTKSATDLRQCKTTRFLCNEENTLPYVNSSGLHFDAYGQCIVLFEGSEITMSDFANKTIQIDIASFEPGSYSSAYHTRLLMHRKDIVWDSGIVFRGSNAVGWSVYAGSNGWGNTFTGMTSRDAISGHTIGVYINSNLKAKLYVDSVSKGTQSVAFPSSLVGLMLGCHDGDITKGNTFYNALVTGLRIYDGEVA